MFWELQYDSFFFRSEGVEISGQSFLVMEGADAGSHLRKEKEKEKQCVRLDNYIKDFV